MTPESIVTSLEWSKKLKEAGYSQARETHFWWVYNRLSTQGFPPHDHDYYMTCFHRVGIGQASIGDPEYPVFAAPTAEEILRRLIREFDVPVGPHLKRTRCKLKLEVCNDGDFAIRYKSSNGYEAIYFKTPSLSRLADWAVELHRCNR